jgi:hypothetical protein
MATQNPGDQLTSEIRFAVGHAAGQFRHFGDERVILFTPIDDYFVL